MCRSPTAEDQLSHVTNFWRQGRAAEFQLNLPNGQAELCLTFQLPSPSEIIPPPFNPALSNPPRDLVRSPHFPRPTFTSPKAASKRQRKHYYCSVVHRATKAASSLPPPEKGSLHEAALACVKRQQADQALQVNKSKRKRQAPSNSSPLAKRMRSDFQIDESEVDQVESPENELLRSHPSLKLKKFLRLLNLLKLNKFLKTQPRGGPPGFATTVMVRGTLPENVFLRGQNTFATTAEAKVTLPETTSA